jgi:hypothetical protein
MTTIEEAKTWLVKHAVAGHPVDCPVCEQRVVIYKRKLNSGMARVLIRAARLALTKEDPHRWLHIHDIFGGPKQDHRDWPLLRWWGFLVPRDKHTAAEKASGFWCVTEEGFNFLRGYDVPRRVHIYNNTCVGFSKERTNVSEALGDHFSYRELLGG